VTTGDVKDCKVDGLVERVPKPGHDSKNYVIFQLEQRNKVAFLGILDLFNNYKQTWALIWTLRLLYCEGSAFCNTSLERWLLNFNAPSC